MIPPIFSIPLRHATDGQELPIGMFVNSIDGNTEMDNLTILNTDIQLWKSESIVLVNKNSGGATHVGRGIYVTTLDAVDTDTVGALKIYCHVPNALPVAVWCVVFNEVIFDQMFAVGMSSGGGVLHARVADSSLYEHDYLEIIQGEEKIVTFVVEAIGRFDSAEATTIRAKFLDPFGNLVSKNGASIVRVCQELDVQVIRVTLDPVDTEQLQQGLLKIELSFDTQKAQLTHSMKIAGKL